MMNKLPWQCIYSNYQAKDAAVARTWIDIGILVKCDAAGVLGLLLEQKLTTVLRMLAYGASADKVDEIARIGKSTTLELSQIL
ncbi:unnamed protein product [Prunus armeniaca]